MQIGFFDRSISQVIERYITNLFSRGALALTCKAGYALYYHPWISKQLNALTGKVIDLDVMRDVLFVYYRKVYQHTVEKIIFDVDFFLKRYYPDAVAHVTFLLNMTITRENFHQFKIRPFCLSLWVEAIVELSGGPIPDYLYRLLTRWVISDHDYFSHLRCRTLSKSRHKGSKWIKGKLIPT